MHGACKICGVAGGQELFYKGSMVRCRLCVNRYNRERYHRQYKAQFAAARRAKDQEKKRIEVTLSDVDRAYAAGLIDGEGCIRITSRGRNGGTGFRKGQHTLMVEVTNTDYGMIQWLSKRFDGSVSYAPASPEINRKERWHWRVSANKALYVLDAIWPYIRTKRLQAKLGRRFQRYAQYPGRAITPKVQAVHERFYNELRAMNKRGVQ
jgi:hypothetical protein